MLYMSIIFSISLGLLLLMIGVLYLIPISNINQSKLFVSSLFTDFKFSYIICIFSVSIYIFHSSQLIELIRNITLIELFLYFSFIIFLSQNIYFYKYYNINSILFNFILIISLLNLLTLLYIDTLLELYLILEIQGICVYIMICHTKNNHFYITIGLKYFILNIMSSFLFIFGCLCIYIHTNNLNLIDLNIYILYMQHSYITLNLYYFLIYIGLFSLLNSLLFKIYAIPLNYWIIDIYIHLEWPIVIYLSTIQFIYYIYIINFLYNILYMYTFNFIFNYIISISILLLICSPLIGCIQTNLKGIIGASSMNMSSIFLISLLDNSNQLYEFIFQYIFIYGIMLFFFFIILNIIHYNNLYKITKKSINYLLLFIGIHNISKLYSILILLIIFTILGIPLFIIFIFKLGLLIIMFNNIIFNTVILCIMLYNTIILTYLYIRILKYIYFYELNNIAHTQLYIYNTNYKIINFFYILIPSIYISILIINYFINITLYNVILLY